MRQYSLQTLAGKIIWFDQGTGPYSNATPDDGFYAEWRDKPADEPECVWTKLNGDPPDIDQPYETRTTRITVVETGKELYSELATTIEIDDESGGEYVKVTQDRMVTPGIAIDPQEWPTIRAAIDKMVGECRV